MLFGMQTASLPPVALHPHPQVKQLPHIKESNWAWLKYHRHVIVSLCLVLREPNLTHFVHTIEQNWGHALQFGCLPRAFPASLTHGSWLHGRCAVTGLSHPAEWEMGRNEQGEVRYQRRTRSWRCGGGDIKWAMGCRNFEKLWEYEPGITLSCDLKKDKLVSNHWCYSESGVCVCGGGNERRLAYMHREWDRGLTGRGWVLLGRQHWSQALARRCTLLLFLHYTVKYVCALKCHPCPSSVCLSPS